MNFSINHERRINDSLKSFEKSGSLTTDQYMKIKALGSKKGILYRISKIHKDIFPPFRPIILAIGTSSCKLAKFLVAILSSITFNGFTVKGSYEFAGEIEHQHGKLFMCSLNVDSLFTIIHLKETSTFVLICYGSLSFTTFHSWLPWNHILCLTIFSTNRRSVSPRDCP